MGYNFVDFTEEDADARYSNILGKYYLAEGIVEKDTIFFATIENNGDKIVKLFSYCIESYLCIFFNI